MDEAAKLLHISKYTLYDYTSKRKIPFYKPTKTILFKRSELIEWMDRFKVRSMEEIDEMATVITVN